MTKLLVSFRYQPTYAKAFVAAVGCKHYQFTLSMMPVSFLYLWDNTGIDCMRIKRLEQWAGDVVFPVEKVGLSGHHGDRQLQDTYQSTAESSDASLETLVLA
jgi:hypothetical protein